MDDKKNAPGDKTRGEIEINQRVADDNNNYTTTIAEKPKTEATIQLLARESIGAILDGKSPDSTQPSSLGVYRDVYAEMVRAFGQGGTEAARKMYVDYAERDAAIAALRAADPEPPKQVWTVDELLTAQFPDPVWLVPGILPAGLVVLAGRPKLGKSWLALQIAVAVGSGGRVLDKSVDRARVLYLALEDNPRRIQDRLTKQKTLLGTNVDFRFEWPALADKRGDVHGVLKLMEAINEHGYRLVVIDTISRALGHADQLDQADMNVTFGRLQQMAMERDICLLLVDHHRKSASGVGDVIDDVMGATSKVGVADAAIGVYRERGQSGAILKVAGRDVEDQELAIQFDPETFCWQLLGTASRVKTDSLQADILAAMGEYGGIATASEIAKFLNKDPGNIHKELQEMKNKGVIKRGEKQGRQVPYEIVQTDIEDD